MGWVKKISGISILLFACLLGCKKEEVRPAYEVAAVFEPYVQSFILEGAKRGHIINFDDTGLLVEFSDKIVNNASGYCYLGQYHVVIDKTEWNMLGEQQKEFLIFHELGHCALDRRHRNDQFNDGIWKSMMRGDPLVGLQQYQPVSYYGFRVDYYRDELFNVQSPAPDWAGRSFGYHDILPGEKELVFEKNNLMRIAEQFSDPGKNVEVELEFSGINTVAYYTDFSWGSASHYFYIQIFKDFGTFIGVYQNGKEQPIFYHPARTDIGGSEFNKITARQHQGVTQLFFNNQYVFHLDEFPGNLNYVRCEAKDGDNTLSTGFKIDAIRLNKLSD